MLVDLTLPALETLAGLDVPTEVNPSKQFSHLFNAYSQAFNKRYNRTGSLFEKPFERKRIASINYFQRIVFYIHNNPVHHGFCERIQDYPWSSYGTFISQKPTKLKRNEIIKSFDSLENFIAFHSIQQDLESINTLLFD